MPHAQCNIIIQWAAVVNDDDDADAFHLQHSIMQQLQVAQEGVRASDWLCLPTYYYLVPGGGCSSFIQIVVWQIANKVASRSAAQRFALPINIGFISALCKFLCTSIAAAAIKSRALMCESKGVYACVCFHWCLVCWDDFVMDLLSLCRQCRSVKLSLGSALSECKTTLLCYGL